QSTPPARDYALQLSGKTAPAQEYPDTSVEAVHQVRCKAYFQHQRPVLHRQEKRCASSVEASLNLVCPETLDFPLTTGAGLRAIAAPPRCPPSPPERAWKPGAYCE